MITGSIKFLVDYVVRDSDKTRYTEGQVVQLPLASCRHFVKKSVAVMYRDPSADVVRVRATRKLNLNDSMIGG